jgi:hypothetical protein
MHREARLCETVRLVRDVGRWPAGAIAHVLGWGPEHALVELVDWDDGDPARMIARRDDLEALPTLAGVDVVRGYRPG